MHMGWGRKHWTAPSAHLATLGGKPSPGQGFGWGAEAGWRAQAPRPPCSRWHRSQAGGRSTEGRLFAQRTCTSLALKVRGL